MNCCSFAITQSIWSEATDAFKKNIYNLEQEDGSISILFKHGINGICKGFALIAIVIVAIATPIFALFDLIYSSVKALFCYEGSYTQQISILEFYQGTPTHDSGLTHDQILAKDDDWLEENDDYIQWLFPTEEKGVNNQAPLSDAKTQQVFKEDPKLREGMKRSYQRMIAFYGFEEIIGEITLGSLRYRKNYVERIENLVKKSHNNLRITRILASLRLHGLEEEAESFIKMLYALATDPRYQANLKEVFNGFWAPAADYKFRIGQEIT